MEFRRNEVWNVVHTYIKENHLLKHCLSVEIAMKAYAKKFGEDEMYWGAVGALHDIDFEKYPEEHLAHTKEILEPLGYDDEFITNIRSHDRKWEPERTRIQKVLLACDEMPGFVIACLLVRPDKDIKHLPVKSVMKKFKDKAFAKAINRETMIESAAAMGVDVKEHIEFIINALVEARDSGDYDNIDLVLPKE